MVGNCVVISDRVNVDKTCTYIFPKTKKYYCCSYYYWQQGEIATAHL
jgi:hypothetical protein